jgi:hypothetical protein
MKSIICTSKELPSIIRKHSRGLKRVHFCIFARPFLPTSEGRGFEGCTLVKVSKKEFFRVATEAILHFEERGAKLRINVPETDFGSFSI